MHQTSYDVPRLPHADPAQLVGPAERARLIGAHGFAGATFLLHPVRPATRIAPPVPEQQDLAA